MNANEKKSFELINKIRTNVQSILPNRRDSNEFYYKTIKQYLLSMVAVAKRAKSIYVADCDKLAAMLSDGPYNGFAYPIQEKILIALDFLEKRIKENEIEDLMVEWDEHTMYDLLTLKIAY
jgi:hypothetical protein